MCAKKLNCQQLLLKLEINKLCALNLENHQLCTIKNWKITNYGHLKRIEKDPQLEFDWVEPIIVKAKENNLFLHRMCQKLEKHSKDGEDNYKDDREGLPADKKK